MPHYAKNFITQVILRADFVSGTVPFAGPIPEELLPVLENYPQRNDLNRTRTDVQMLKTPQGPVKDSRTITFLEHNFWTEDKTVHGALCSEYVFLSQKQYDGYLPFRDDFLDLLEATANQFPDLRIRRLGFRYVNEIKLPEADAGPGLGADFWEHYINPWLLGGLRFAANDGALARHMCTTELNYGTDRATIRYGIYNGEYPKPNRRREFVLDVDTFSTTEITPASSAAKLDNYHRAACQVFEAAITDQLRARMGQA